ncbi:MAG: glycosyltransferase [Clostridia bacterium]|nr:glycosyltransferase [Clostridia bacterium]
MKITIVSDVLLEENNGLNVATMNLIRSLKTKGHEVKILCANQKKKGEEGYYIVPTRSFGKLIDRYVTKNGVSFAKPDKNIITDAIKGSDIVHTVTNFSLAQNAAKIAEELNIPITSGFHTQAENISSHFLLKWLKPLNYYLYKSFYRKLYKRSTAVHYPTQFIREIFEKVVGKTNGYVISNGVNKRFKKVKVEKPEELKDKFVILFTGRYSKEKSHKILIKAIANSKYKDKIQLIFAGEGPLKEKLQNLSKKLLPVQPIFKFFSRDDLVKTINYADLYVHPAEIEIEAIACLEAITCGVVPVIANSPRCATKSFALDDRNLFKNKDSKDLANKIDYWIEHSKEKQECSKNYLGYTTKFDQDYCMDKMEEMLIETIENYNKDGKILSKKK